MKKQLTIKTNEKEKLYKITSTSSNNKFWCYYNNGSIFTPWTEFGQSKTFDDAITICKAHAGSGSEVKQIKDI